MSWFSNVINKARENTDTLGKRVGLSDTQRKYFRYGVSSMGGGMGIQYEYSRDKGMNSNEATKNSLTGGYSYSQARQEQKTREGIDSDVEKNAIIMRDQAANENRDRLAQLVKIRRRGQGENVSTKSGTLTNGSLGIPGSRAASTLGT